LRPAETEAVAKANVFGGQPRMAAGKGNDNQAGDQRGEEEAETPEPIYAGIFLIIGKGYFITKLIFDTRKVPLVWKQGRRSGTTAR
jgi:hypothetical protein